MSDLEGDSRGYLEQLRQRLRQEIDGGRFDVARELCEEAIERARALGDPEVLDLATCNRGGILIAQGEGERAVRDLRKILLRSASPANSFLAAYYVSQHHKLAGENQRSLFYARLALDHARHSDHPDFVASSHNRIANLLMLDSYFDEACGHFDQALELLPEDHPLDRALILSNSGYCCAVLGRYPQAFRRLFRSLRVIRDGCARSWERFPHLGLSFAYLELGRYERARWHGAKALRRSEEADSPEQVKNALYLLGETEKLGGDEETAWEHFHRLQTEFYPDKPYVTDFLIATDIRKLINLMA